MLKAEARWVAGILGQMDLASCSPVLNVGSSDSTFREQVQPWINSEIFAPMQERGAKVYHLDFRTGAGIDLHGDLTDDSFVEGLHRYGFKSLLCCNLLEHVVNPASICSKLEQLVPVGGRLIITVPNRFPYHPDPIDTMFRPSVSELTNLFSRCRLLVGAELDCETGWDYLERNPRVLISRLAHRLASPREFGGVRGSSGFFPYLFKKFRMTCAAFEKGAR